MGIYYYIGVILLEKFRLDDITNVHLSETCLFPLTLFEIFLVEFILIEETSRDAAIVFHETLC